MVDYPRRIHGAWQETPQPPQFRCRGRVNRAPNRVTPGCPGAGAGLSGPPPASPLHRVDPHPPPRHETASIWSRRRVLLLNSTYEPLTALPMRRGIGMVIPGEGDGV